MECTTCERILNGEMLAVQRALGLTAERKVRLPELVFGLGRFEQESLEVIAEAAHRLCHGWTHCGDSCCGPCPDCGR